MTETQKEIRIVIPAFKACDTILSCLEAVLISISFHQSWEIIIVDNGGNPNIQLLLKGYPITILERFNDESAAYARNEGAKGFNNGILVFIDSDVICEENCIKNLINPIQKKYSDATIGNYSKKVKKLNFSQKYKQLYINHIYSRTSSVVKNDFWTAICSVDAKVFHDLNGFNEIFKGANGEDQEFGIRLTKSGYRILSAKNAKGKHLHPYDLFNIIRNDFKKGLTAVKNSLEHDVPFSDNRHSRLLDILSVFFSVLTTSIFTFNIFYSCFLMACITTFLLWFMCRISLSYSFLKSAGLFFFLRALMLMFSLDLIRFTCVVIGILKHKILKSMIKEQKNLVSITIK